MFLPTCAPPLCRCRSSCGAPAAGRDARVAEREYRRASALHGEDGGCIRNCRNSIQVTSATILLRTCRGSSSVLPWSGDRTALGSRDSGPERPRPAPRGRSRWRAHSRGQLNMPDRRAPHGRRPSVGNERGWQRFGDVPERGRHHPLTQHSRSIGHRAGRRLRPR